MSDKDMTGDEFRAALIEVMDREICVCQQCEDEDNYNNGARAVRAAVLKFLNGGSK